jgi:hypothetical protein
VHREAASPLAGAGAAAGRLAAEACRTEAKGAECTTEEVAAASGPTDRLELVEAEAAASRLPPGPRAGGRAAIRAAEVAASLRPSCRAGSEAAEDSRSLASLLQFEVG